jgi:pyruvate/2-oxoglutarate dehydrogenase complex dihydrolipoamide acyltransferase (E2) component
MRVAIHIPQTGTQSAATFVQWSVAIGDRVAAGAVLGTVETDKALVEIEAPASGLVIELLAQANDEVSTDVPIGAIEADDSTARAAAPAQQPPPPPATATPPAAPSLEWPAAQRRAAENLLWVSQHTAPAATTIEVDFECVAALRESLKAQIQRSHGIALTYLPFIAFAVARSAARFPLIMAQVNERGDALTMARDVHLGIAVAREQLGLIVPVIRAAQRLGFGALARRLNQVADQARQGVLSPEELRGGNLTLTNPGAFGSLLSAPIVRRGESAIVCIDGIHRRVVPVGGQTAIRRIGNLTLAFDHRVIDGQLALKVLNDIKAQLEAFHPGGEYPEAPP